MTFIGTPDPVSMFWPNLTLAKLRITNMGLLVNRDSCKVIHRDSLLTIVTDNTDNANLCLLTLLTMPTILTVITMLIKNSIFFKK